MTLTLRSNLWYSHVNNYLKEANFSRKSFVWFSTSFKDSIAEIMGNWKLEVGRMAMYMSFPVILFHIFNQPTYFEEWVTNTKREIYPPENKQHREDIQNLIKDMRKKQMATLETE